LQLNKLKTEVPSINKARTPNRMEMRSIIVSREMQVQAKIIEQAIKINKEVKIKFKEITKERLGLQKCINKILTKERKLQNDIKKLTTHNNTKSTPKKDYEESDLTWDKLELAELQELDEADILKESYPNEVSIEHNIMNTWDKSRNTTPKDASYLLRTEFKIRDKQKKSSKPVSARETINSPMNKCTTRIIELEEQVEKLKEELDQQLKFNEELVEKLKHDEKSLLNGPLEKIEEEDERTINDITKELEETVTRLKEENKNLLIINKELTKNQMKEEIACLLKDLAFEHLEAIKKLNGPVTKSSSNKPIYELLIDEVIAAQKISLLISALPSSNKPLIPNITQLNDTAYSLYQNFFAKGDKSVEEIIKDKDECFRGLYKLYGEILQSSKVLSEKGDDCYMKLLNEMRGLKEVLSERVVDTKDVGYLQKELQNKSIEVSKLKQENTALTSLLGCKAAGEIMRCKRYSTHGKSLSKDFNYSYGVGESWSCKRENFLNKKHRILIQAEDNTEVLKLLKEYEEDLIKYEELIQKLSVEEKLLEEYRIRIDKNIEQIVDRLE